MAKKSQKTSEIGTMPFITTAETYNHIEHSSWLLSQSLLDAGGKSIGFLEQMELFDGKSWQDQVLIVQAILRRSKFSSMLPGPGILLDEYFGSQFYTCVQALKEAKKPIVLKVIPITTDNLVVSIIENQRDVVFTERRIIPVPTLVLLVMRIFLRYHTFIPGHMITSLGAKIGTGKDCKILCYGKKNNEVLRYRFYALPKEMVRSPHRLGDGKDYSLRKMSMLVLSNPLAIPPIGPN